MKCPNHRHLNWADYTKGKIKNEEEYRKALETCEHCLQLFIGCLENNLESPSPGFVDRVMGGLPENSSEKRKVWAWAWLHYAAAACITVILVHFGFFDYISQLPGELQNFDQFFISDYYFHSLLERLKDFLSLF